MDNWPAGTSLSTFVSAASTWGSLEDLELHDGRYWYDDKTFYIETEGVNYGNVKILRIITLSSDTIVLIFDYNGYITYIPFNKVIRMQEVK